MDVAVNIRKAENGYIIRYDDPDIAKANREDDDNWQDPSKEILSDTPEKAMKVIQKVLTKMAGESELAGINFDSAFDEAMEK